jgi:glycosidase
VFVRSFKDSNDDGVGDFKGLTDKLDYLKELGVRGLWLMPVNASQSYHGYDVTNYYEVNPQYGTMEEFQTLIKEAHERDILVVMDLVLNHTSAYHPWFVEAKSRKDSKYRDYYVWADENTNTKEKSSINTKPWVKLNVLKNDYYYAVFTGSMPDLNYDNEQVRQKAKDIAKFYLNMGIDGFRLDASKHIFDKETDKNVTWWQEFNKYVKAENPNAVLVGEVWDKSEVIAEYMKSLDTCFNFDASESILNALFKNELGGLSGKLQKIYDQYSENNSFVDSPFLSNHDTIRVMTRLQNVENINEDVTEKAKKAGAILLTLPGTPYIYYGEETGMKGSKPDEQLREPFIWDNKDRKQNTSWENSVNHVDNIAVSVHENNPDSILNFYKKIIALRNGNEVLKYGSFKALDTDSSNVTGYKRVLGDKEVYIFINGSTDPALESINISNGKILYSNSRSNTSISFANNTNKNLYLKANEILILEKTN